MIPKEKALELVDKFKKYCDVDDHNGVLDWEECLKYNAKQCALIAVDEIIVEIYLDQYYSQKRINYLQEVKNEINKL